MTSKTDKVQHEIRLSRPISAKLDLICLDSLTMKPKYGQRSEIIEVALLEYFSRYYPQRAKPE